ncbi:hypothetical protein HDE_09861 [Halotydeus destructor]|nr:hypothetical protein HDE_09861 [Halotydeus destructor]
MCFKMNATPVLFTISPRPPNFYFVKYVLVACLIIVIIVEIVIAVVGMMSLQDTCMKKCLLEDQRFTTDEMTKQRMVLLTTVATVALVSLIGLVGTLKENYVVTMIYSNALLALGIVNCFGDLEGLSTANVAVCFFVSGIAFCFSTMVRVHRNNYQLFY